MKTKIRMPKARRLWLDCRPYNFSASPMQCRRDDIHGIFVPDDPELVERVAKAIAEQCRTTGWWAPKRLAVAAIRAVSPLLLKGHK